MTDWIQSPIHWVLVGLAIMLSVLDVLWTLNWVKSYGAAGEANPAIRWLFGSNLQFVWSMTSVAATSLGVIVLASMCTILTGTERRLPVLGLSILLTVKTLVVLSHLLFYTEVATATLVLIVSGPLVFTLVLAILAPEAPARLARVLRLGVEIVRDARVALVTHSGSRQVRGVPVLSQKPDAAAPQRGPIRTVIQTRKLVTWLIVLILAPTLGLMLIEAISGLAGMSSIPDWMKRLGIVSQIQGQVFGLSFIVILVVTGILVYAVLRIFEAIGGK